MSSHFNYEIDERNMRDRFKAFAPAFTDSAWNSFEEYNSKNTKSKSFENPIKLNFALNKNFIMPIIFGTIIIGFSLILFNFINIKNKPDLVQKNAVIDNAPIKKPEVPKVVDKKIIPAVVDTIKKIDTSTVKTLSTTITPSVAATTTIAATKTIAPTPTVEIKSTEITSTGKKYRVIEQGGIYIDPSIKSEQIGTTKLKEEYTALEEKIYFIKVEFTKNGSKKIGYIRKSHIAENGKNTPVNNSNALAKPKKPKNVEQLETITPSAGLLPVGASEKELELK